MYHLPVYQLIKQRLEEPRRLIQVVMGPRQVGKSTVVNQVLRSLDIPYRYFTADNVPATNRMWIEQCWEVARIQQRNLHTPVILVIDEIQKIAHWSEMVKKLWDEDTLTDIPLKVLLLGSSRILLEKGLADSMAGRFEEIRMSHWSYKEMHDCFGIDINQYIYYGGYPGAAPLINEPERFEQYIQSAIIDATLNKDILMDNVVAKPALLRQTFELACAYSGEIVSLNKMLGQLQDAGNTTTMTHYLHLLNQSCMVTGLMKFTNEPFRTKSSIPKFQVYDNALQTFYKPLDINQALLTPHEWGHIFESAIGSYIIGEAFKKRFEVYYWRNRNLEVDFILRHKGRVVAIEVKSNYENKTAGMEEFKKLFHPDRAIIVGKGGIESEEFLSLNLKDLF